MSMEYPENGTYGGGGKKPAPDAVASTDTSRPILTNVNLSVDEDGQAWLEATDSYAMVRLPVTIGKRDVPGFIPPQALIAARKDKNASMKLTKNKAIVKGDGSEVSFDRTQDGTFPNCAKLIPESESEFAIGLNVDLLSNVAKGLGTKTIRLSFSTGDGNREGLSPLRPMIVRPTGRSDARIGILMPVRLQA